MADLANKINEHFTSITSDMPRIMEDHRIFTSQHPPTSMARYTISVDTWWRTPKEHILTTQSQGQQIYWPWWYPPMVTTGKGIFMATGLSPNSHFQQFAEGRIHSQGMEIRTCGPTTKRSQSSLCLTLDRYPSPRSSQKCWSPLSWDGLTMTSRIGLTPTSSVASREHRLRTP